MKTRNLKRRAYNIIENKKKLQKNICKERAEWFTEDNNDLSQKTNNTEMRKEYTKERTKSER